MPQMMALFPTSGPIQALREASPQAVYHFTRFDQVNQLVWGKRSSRVRFRTSDSVGLSGMCSFDRDVQRLRCRKGKVEFLKPYNMSIDILH